jgi:hypothetical protein
VSTHIAFLFTILMKVCIDDSYGEEFLSCTEGLGAMFLKMPEVMGEASEL